MLLKSVLGEKIPIIQFVDNNIIEAIMFQQNISC